MRLAVYISHYETLGHITRIASILEGLKESKNRTKILIIHSGKRQEAINLERYGEVIYLPYSIGRKGLFLEENRLIYNKILNSDGTNFFLKKRLGIMKNVLRKFKPEIFITEYYPFGREFWSFELPYILKYIKENFKSKVFSSVGYPSWMLDTNKMLKEFYSGIFFHCPRTYYNGYLNFLEENSPGRKVLSETIRDFSKRIYFTGYILNKKQLIPIKSFKKKLHINNKQKLIVVSRGGGIVNSKIIFCSLGLAKSMKNVYFLISTGPATTEQEFKKYRYLSRKLKNVKIAKYLPYLEGYLNDADLSINMAGYNTIVRLLWLKKQSIVIPFKTDEQRFRAHYLEKFGIFKTLSYESLSFESLRKNVLDMLNNPLDPLHLIGSVDFNGVENMVELIENA